MTDIMKLSKIFALSFAALTLASCADDKFNYDKNEAGRGTLSFAGLSIDYSEEMVTKAEAADGTYMLYVYDAGKSLVYNQRGYMQHFPACRRLLPRNTLYRSRST